MNASSHGVECKKIVDEWTFVEVFICERIKVERSSTRKLIQVMGHQIEYRRPFQSNTKGF